MKLLFPQIGNCTTAQVEALFRSRFDDIEAFAEDSSASVLFIELNFTPTAPSCIIGGIVDTVGRESAGSAV